MGINQIGRVCAQHAAPSAPPAPSHSPVVALAPRTPLPSNGLPLGERLRRAWDVGRLATVPDREMPAAVASLIQHHVDVGFYGERMDGMRRLTGFGADGTLEVQLAPNRTKVPLMREGDGEALCALCDPPYPEERGLSWRSWRVWPNAFPYVPAELEHILLTRGEHVEQRFSSAILGDIIDFQACLEGGRQLTMHYNGIAGNSQAHLHWQACRATVPLQREIDSGRMRLTDLLRTPAGRVGSFDQGSYCGVLVEGDKGFVLRWADHLVTQLERDPVTRGAYNLVLLQRRDGRPRLLVFPRRADYLKVTVEPFGRVGVGGFNVAGVVVVPRAEVPASFSASIGAALRATQVPPAELSWLAELASQSRATLPFAQAILPTH